MALTKVQIISNAVTMLGHKPILSLDGQGDMITAAEQAFDFLLPSKLSEGFWRFATTLAQLSQIEVTPPVEVGWQYVYQLPGDYLKLVRLHPHNYNFEIFENKRLYSNLDQTMYIEYVRQITDVAKLPAYFSHYFVFELALYLCLSTANSAQFYQVLKPERDILYATALANDAQNRPQSPLASQPVISNRWVTTWARG